MPSKPSAMGTSVPPSSVQSVPRTDSASSKAKRLPTYIKRGATSDQFGSALHDLVSQERISGLLGSIGLAALTPEELTTEPKYGYEHRGSLLSQMSGKLYTTLQQWLEPTLAGLLSRFYIENYTDRRSVRKDPLNIIKDRADLCLAALSAMCHVDFRGDKLRGKEEPDTACSGSQKPHLLDALRLYSAILHSTATGQPLSLRMPMLTTERSNATCTHLIDYMPQTATISWKHIVESLHGDLPSRVVPDCDEKSRRLRASITQLAGAARVPGPESVGGHNLREEAFKSITACLSDIKSEEQTESGLAWNEQVESARSFVQMCFASAAQTKDGPDIQNTVHQKIVDSIYALSQLHRRMLSPSERGANSEVASASVAGQSLGSELRGPERPSLPESIDVDVIEDPKLVPQEVTYASEPTEDAGDSFGYEIPDIYEMLRIP